VADTGNFTIRQIIISTGTTTTIAGLAGTSGSTDGAGSSARFYQPSGITTDNKGNLYIADTDNQTIRIGILPSKPTIQVQPQSQTVTQGYSTTLSVTATGNPVPTYQWSFNNSPISGATNSQYQISNAQQANAGSYTVTVSNPLGNVTSNTATLTVSSPNTDNGGGSSGGGGGGAPSMWFYGSILLIAAVRIFHGRMKVELPLTKNL
jgi:hypothetical protein